MMYAYMLPETLIPKQMHKNAGPIMMRGTGVRKIIEAEYGAREQRPSGHQAC